MRYLHWLKVMFWYHGHFFTEVNESCCDSLLSRILKNLRKFKTRVTHKNIGGDPVTQLNVKNRFKSKKLIVIIQNMRSARLICMWDDAIHYKLYQVKWTMAFDIIVFRIIKGHFNVHNLLCTCMSCTIEFCRLEKKLQAYFTWKCFAYSFETEKGKFFF